MNDPTHSSPHSVLTPPEPVRPVEGEQAASMVPISDEQRAKLEQKIRDFIEIVVRVDVNSQAFREKIDSVHNMGNREIRAAANMSNRMLDRPMKSMNDGVFDDRSPIGSSLLELRNTVERLDPSRQGDLFSITKLFGLIPMGNKLKQYFRQYQSAQTQINAILQSLYNGQDELRKDNAAIDTEKVGLWETMSLLEQYVYVGKAIDEALTERIADIESRDPEKARVVKEEMLYYVRQKVQDLLTQLTVSVQGYLALDMIRKNNL
ncbi:MAG: toxic anion resistance protein, partial [Gammaproteobacteria bacterium]